MFRSLVVLATVVCALQCPTADAKGRLGKWLRGAKDANHAQSANSHRSHSEPTFLGFGIGVGSYPPYNYPRPGEFNPYRFDSYLYDPYRYGSFEAPDLLNDPYFRERHRYDSRFPGRRHRQ